ncbi:MAG: hypothetical protein IAE90_10415 [Ignavibacteria bacterium]|nr:hypothetical protein [Ignavibacteria bacterium]
MIFNLLKRTVGSFAHFRLFRCGCIIALLFLSIATNIYSGDSTKAINPFFYWEGSDSVMSLQKLASYCAPVFWFSADEPELYNKKGKDIKIPVHFPFDKPTDTPVVYYQFKNFVARGDDDVSPYVKDTSAGTDKKVDLTKISAFEIYYSHFYSNEAGLGGHKYDTEQAQFRVYVNKPKTDSVRIFQLIILEATGKAHALAWYDNIWMVDPHAIEVKLPMHILVEEGKHASCPDINGDGYYTPGYDVNLRTNDAWGVRDVIRTGILFASEYHTYYSKVRLPEYKVMPPLPEDSPLRKRYTKDSVYSPDNAVYQLREFPNPRLAGRDEHLRHDMESYYLDKKPKMVSEGSIDNWFEDEMYIRSFAFAFRAGRNEYGISIAFPLLLVKNVEAPLIGGWIVNRMYFQDKFLRDIGYTLLYTPSASRFMDPYLSAGFEMDREVNAEGKSTTEWKPVLETGLKFRANVSYSPLKFLRFISPFWGFRIGIKNTGFPLIKDLNYILEFGAGVW